MTSYFCIPVPYNEKVIFFLLLLVLEGLIGLHRTVQFQRLQHYWSRTWITMKLNDLPWKRIEIILSFLRLHPSTAFRYQVLHSFVDYDGYSISSKGFLPTVVDVMVI